MMVTFVSQCEKKALGRTRRVLDAFANRIGDNTWQTVITEEGLIAVKTLLRKTATKNTAVACHWLRSRSRSELVWIVGNRDQFSPQGITPVNATTKELFMDIPNDKPNPNWLYANTHLQTLAEHLFAVGYVAEQLHRRLITNNDHSEAIFVTGCLHDLGKIDPAFQEWAINPKKKAFEAEDGQHIDDAKFSFDKHPRHNEISVLLYELLDPIGFKDINTANKMAIKHAVYWHHAKPYRKEKDPDFASYGGIHKKLSGNLSSLSFAELVVKAQKLLKDLSEMDCRYRAIEDSFLAKIYSEEVDLDLLARIKTTPLPTYKSYEANDRIESYQQQIKENAFNNIIRACVISADRLVSGLSAADLHEHIKFNTLANLIHETLLLESTICSHIETCLTRFPIGERSSKQREVAQKLSKVPGVAVLAGPAGCGKTKIALEWALLKNAQQIIWICPRVQVCQGIFDDLTSNDYFELSLPSLKIEINTGEFKYTNEWNKPTEELFSGDIVITTIDQIFSGIISHNNIDTLVKFLNAHIVFDEFHEYIAMPAFNLLFAELVACKQQQEGRANTLLVSATPHYFYLKSVLGIEPEDIIAMTSFNPSTYRIDFMVFDETRQDDSNPLYQRQNGNTIVISNTAQAAQKSFIRNQDENSVLLHSKFKKRDKQIWFNEVFESFKKDGTRKFDVLRSGPIVQASLNITCDYMVAEITTAENFLQRLGRLDRFGDNTNTNVYCIAVPEPIHQGKGTGSSARFLARQYSFAATKTWYQFLQAEQLEDKIIQLPELYALYQKFHDSGLAQQSMASDLLACFKQGVQLINQKVLDPITIPTKKTTVKGRGKISKHSLRGENRFVQMAKCDVSNWPEIRPLEEYAYEMPISEQDEFDNLTASIDEIQGYGDSDKNLLAYMKAKHHNVIGGTKAFKDFILLNEARDPELPIYLSYTPEGLDRVGGDSARHSYAIYYAVCDKQPIGAISIKHLTSTED